MVQVSPTVTATAASSVAKRSTTLRITAGLLLLGGIGYFGKQLVAPGLAADLSSSSIIGTVWNKLQPTESTGTAVNFERISLATLREQHPTNSEQRYAHKWLEFDAQLATIQAPRTLMLSGEPPAFCQLASGQTLPHHSINTVITLRGEFQKVGEQGFEFSNCEVVLPH